MLRFHITNCNDLTGPLFGSHRIMKYFHFSTNTGLFKNLKLISLTWMFPTTCFYCFVSCLWIRTKIFQCKPVCEHPAQAWSLCPQTFQNQPTWFSEPVSEITTAKTNKTDWKNWLQVPLDCDNSHISLVSLKTSVETGGRKINRILYFIVYPRVMRQLRA